MKFLKQMLAFGLSAAMLVSCSGQKVSVDPESKTKLESALKTYPKEGARLPYSVLRSDLKDAMTSRNFEIRNGGFGSAMTAHPTMANQFYAVTDRGPNATYNGKYGKGKTFPTPDYTPRIGLFELKENGKIDLVKEILLKDRDGKVISGLPNTGDLGGTGETPYTVDGKPILVDMNKPFDKTSNPLKLDMYGLDSEGLVALSDGTFWISDEYGPHMVHYDANGKEIGRINAFPKDSRNTHFLPLEFGNRRANRGMEGLAITPDEKTLVGIMQSTMYNPSKKVKKLDITRIVTVNLESGKISQYLYRQEKAQNSNSEIVAVGPTEFLVIERDGKFIKDTPNPMKRVYKIDLSTGTDLETIPSEEDLVVQDVELGLTINGNTLEQIVLLGGWDLLMSYGIKPVSKTLVVDMVKEVGYPHDKMEGLWVMANGQLGVLNDDDFATWSTKGKLHQKMLDSNTVDGNSLYIVDMK